MLKLVYTKKIARMVNQTRTKITKVGSRHTIYLEKAFVEDSAFPFEPNQPLIAKVEKNKIVIESE
jgi:hypothetical protein